MPFGIQPYYSDFKTLFADDGIAFIVGHPSSPWPRSEEDIRRQEIAEAWMEVEKIAPGLPKHWEPAIWPVGIDE